MAKTWGWCRRTISAKSSTAPLRIRSSSSASSFTGDQHRPTGRDLFRQALADCRDGAVHEIVHPLLKLVHFRELVSGQYGADFAIEFGAFNRQVGLDGCNLGVRSADFGFGRAGLLDGFAQVDARIME